MLMTVEELKKYIQTDVAEEVLAAKLSALELLIRQYTNNNFQMAGIRRNADIVGGEFIVNSTVPFKVGDTVQVSVSVLNRGLYTVSEVAEHSFKVKENEELTYETNVLVTRVDYPLDVKLGAASMLDWELKNQDKVGIASETLSRHSVSYADPNGDNYVMGYPKALTGFLKVYKKARF